MPLDHHHTSHRHFAANDSTARHKNDYSMIPRRNFVRNTLATMAALWPVSAKAGTTDQPQFAVYFSRSGSTAGQGLREALIVSHEHSIEVRFKFNDRLIRAFPNGEWEENGVRHPHYPYAS